MDFEYDKIIRVNPIRHDRERELGAFAHPRDPPLQELRHRKHRLATGTHLSPRCPNLTHRRLTDLNP